MIFTKCGFFPGLWIPFSFTDDLAGTRGGQKPSSFPFGIIGFSKLAVLASWKGHVVRLLRDEICHRWGRARFSRKPRFFKFFCDSMKSSQSSAVMNARVVTVSGVTWTSFTSSYTVVVWGLGVGSLSTGSPSGGGSGTSTSA